MQQHKTNLRKNCGEKVIIQTDFTQFRIFKVHLAGNDGSVGVDIRGKLWYLIVVNVKKGRFRSRTQPESARMVRAHMGKKRMVAPEQPFLKEQ